MRRKTHEEYVNEIKNSRCDIDVIGTYINASTPIAHTCKEFGHTWNASPTNILYGGGCPECAIIKRRQQQLKSHDKFVEEVASINSNIKIIGVYNGANSKVLCKCKLDDHEWFARPLNILSGTGCPKCAGLEKYTTDTFKQELYNINKNITVLGEYVNNKTKVLCRCALDNFEWEAVPSSLLSGHGCPKCNESHGERSIYNYLINHNVQFKTQYTFDNCRNVKLLPFDFYLFKYNTCIEYDGIQHFKAIDYFGGEDAFKEIVKRDAIKTNYCLSNCINLLRIRYDEDITDTLDNFFHNTKLLEEAV